MTVQVADLTLASLLSWLDAHDWPNRVILSKRQYGTLGMIMDRFGRIDHQTGSIYYAGVQFIREPREVFKMLDRPEDFPDG